MAAATAAAAIAARTASSQSGQGPLVLNGRRGRCRCRSWPSTGTGCEGSTAHSALRCLVHIRDSCCYDSTAVPRRAHLSGQTLIYSQPRNHGNTHRRGGPSSIIKPALRECAITCTESAPTATGNYQLSSPRCGSCGRRLRSSRASGPMGTRPRR